VQRINERLQASLAGSPVKQPHAADASAPGLRSKIDKMSAEVVDSNPYSRLMALQRMGIVKDYERIREKTVSKLYVIECAPCYCDCRSLYSAMQVEQIALAACTLEGRRVSELGVPARQCYAT